MYFRNLTAASTEPPHASGAQHPLGWVNLAPTGECFAAFQTFTIKNNAAKSKQIKTTTVLSFCKCTRIPADEFLGEEMGGQRAHACLCTTF